MKIKKSSLTRFLNNFLAKIFNNGRGGVKIKFDIFMEVFEVGDHPHFVVTAVSATT